MKDMFKEMIKEMTTTTKENEYEKQIERNNDDISYEKEQEDEEMDILSSDEDTNLYTDQDTTKNVRSSQTAHKKKEFFQKKEDFVSTKQKVQIVKSKEEQKTQHQSHKLNKEQSSWNTIIDHVPNNIPHPKTTALNPS